MNKQVIIRPNNIPSQVDMVLGFDKYEEGRFPGCKSGMPPFKFQNGTYRHGMPLVNGKKSEERLVVEQALLNGDDLDSTEGKRLLSNFLIEFGSDVQFLNLDNPEDLLRYYCILASQDFVAPSRADAKAKSMSHRAYVIEEYGEDKKEKLSIKQKVNKARAKLSELDTTPEYMIALAQYIAPANAGIKTENDAYIYLDEVISGKFNDGSELAGANRFFGSLNVDKEIIFVAAIVKEAINKNIIRKVQGIYSNPLTKTTLGRTEEEVINYLIQDEAQEELGLDLATDKPYSIRYQLKNRKT